MVRFHARPCYSIWYWNLRKLGVPANYHIELKKNVLVRNLSSAIADRGIQEIFPSTKYILRQYSHGWYLQEIKFWVFTAAILKNYLMAGISRNYNPQIYERTIKCFGFLRGGNILVVQCTPWHGTFIIQYTVLIYYIYQV